MIIYDLLVTAHVSVHSDHPTSTLCLGNGWRVYCTYSGCTRYLHGSDDNKHAGPFTLPIAGGKRVLTERRVSADILLSHIDRDPQISNVH